EIKAVMIARSLARGLLIACGSAVLAAGCSRGPSTQVDAARPVRTLVVAAGGETHSRFFPGKVEASRKVELAFQVPGLLVQFPVREGQRVAEGDIIAQLRQDEFQARVKALQGQLDQARASLRALHAGERPEQQLRLEAQVRAAEAKLANARVEIDRSRRLMRTNAIARSQLDADETAFRLAQEEHEAARQMLEKGTVAREEDIEAKEAAVR